MKSNQDESKELSAYEKGGSEGVDPRCIPQRLDGPVPEHEDITYPDYPVSDQETWKFLYNRQMDLLPGRACDEYLEGARRLNLSADRIPTTPPYLRQAAVLLRSRQPSFFRSGAFS